MSTRRYILALAGDLDSHRPPSVVGLLNAEPSRPEHSPTSKTTALAESWHFELAVPVAGAASERPTDASVQSSRTLAGEIVHLPRPADLAAGRSVDLNSIDAALLVVAADDRRSSRVENDLLTLACLGLNAAVVVVLMTPPTIGCETELIADVRASLRPHRLDQSPVVSLSDAGREDIHKLTTALAEVLDRVPSHGCGKPRVAVETVGPLKDDEVLVTGLLTGGTLTRGQTIALHPGGLTARIVALSGHRGEVESCGHGTPLAIRLHGIAARDTVHPRGAARGDVVTVVGSGRPASSADVLLEKSPHVIGGKSAADHPLKDRARVRVHVGCASVPATVFLHEQPALVAGARALAQLRLESPLHLFLNDRLILQDESGEALLAGGRVLDPDGDRKFWQAKAQMALLVARAASQDLEVCVRTEIARRRITRRDLLLSKSPFTVAEVGEVVVKLTGEGVAIDLGGFVADASWWTDLMARARTMVESEHRAWPERVGLSVSELESKLADELPEAAVFEALVDSLLRSGLRRVGDRLQSSAHEPSLPPRLHAAGQHVIRLLADKPLEPPSVKELAADSPSQQALRFFIETGQAVEVGTGIVLSATAYTTAVERIRAYLVKHGHATVGELCRAVGTTRRIMIPLAEKLDAEGVTCRAGDRRSLATKR